MLKLFKIHGESLSPLLFAGDYVLAVKLPCGLLARHPHIARKILKIGKLVVLIHPQFGRIVKIICQQLPDGVYLRGANAQSTSTSALGKILFADCQYLVIKAIQAPR